MNYNRCYGVSNESPYNSASIDTHNWEFDENKAGYTATSVACGWAGAVIEVPRSFGQEQ